MTRRWWLSAVLALAAAVLTGAAAVAAGSHSAARLANRGEAPGKILSGGIPHDGGFGLVVFEGGPTYALLAELGCPSQRLAFWVTAPSGDFAQFVPGSTVAAVNAAFDGLFPGRVLPTPTALLGRCAPAVVVVLDPGHGSHDEPGAASYGVIERDSNLDLALRVEELLKRAGVQVVLTRRTDGRAETFAHHGLTGPTATFLDLQARATMANAVGGTAFVSIHSNSWQDPRARGVEAWYSGGRPFADASRTLGALTVAGVIDELWALGHDVPSGGVRDDETLVDATGRDTPLFVLGPERDVSRRELLGRGVDPHMAGVPPDQPWLRTTATSMPGVLLELLYVSNATDAALLSDEAARAAIARGVAAGILLFVGGS